MEEIKREIDDIENLKLYFSLDPDYKHGNKKVDSIISKDDYVITGEDEYRHSYGSLYSYIDTFKETSQLVNKDVPFYVNWYITDDCMLVLHYIFLYANNKKKKKGGGGKKGGEGGEKKN